MFTAAKRIIKPIYFWSMSQTPIIKRRLQYLSKSQAIIILNLHKVSDNDCSAYKPLSKALFEELIEFCITHFYVTSFSELSEKTSKPRLILSFDDGYYDFFENVVPILERKQVKVNQNIIPKCAETGLPPLNVMIQDFLGQAPENLASSLKIPGYAGIPNAGDSRQISNYIKFLTSDQREKIEFTLQHQIFAWAQFKPTKMMSRQNIKDLADCHEIGAHSFSHASLGVETVEFAKNDAERCMRWFNNEIGISPSIYALPNGSYLKEQIPVIKGEGFSTILFVEERLNSGCDAELGGMRRFTFDARSISEMKYRALGKREDLR